MITVAVILISAFLIWYGIGFSSKRRINKENKMLHAMGMGKRPSWFVNGDKGIFPWRSVPPFFSKPTFKAMWTMPVRGSIDDLPKKNSLGNTISYSTPKEIAGLAYKIVVASDVTNKLPKLNKQILVIEIQFPICAKTYYITLGAVFTISNGIKFIELKDGILTYIEREVKDAINPWFITEEEKWQKKWELIPPQKVKIGDKEELVKESFSLYVLRQMELIRIDKLNTITIPVYNENGDEVGTKPFRKYLDEERFLKYGFRFGELSYELGYGEDVEDLKKQRNEQENQKEQLNTNVATEKAKDVKRQTALNDAKNEAQRVNVLWVEQQKVAEKLAGYAAQVAGAYKVQVLSTGGDNKFVEQMMGPLAAGLITLKPKNSQQNQGGNDEQN